MKLGASFIDGLLSLRRCVQHFSASLCFPGGVMGTCSCQECTLMEAEGYYIGDLVGAYSGHLKGWCRSVLLTGSKADRSVPF